MFTSFEQVHEECLSQLVSGEDLEPFDGDTRQVEEALAALMGCRGEVVQQLKDAQAIDLRQNLRTFYEALSAVIELVERLRSDSRSSTRISSAMDDAEPHGLGIKGV